MRNALKVLVRDLRRFARVPQAVIIIIGIIVIPSLYAWLNIIAFWDPYTDTKAVKVAVVNLDKGASSELTGPIDIGSQVVEQLKKNDQLGWTFMGKQEAMTAVESADAYAAIVIPADFSKNLLSVTSEDFVRPKLDYYVNEKANAIAPKITGVGSSTLETQINSTFVSTVAEKVASALEAAGENLGDRLALARDDSVDELGDAAKQVSAARQGIADLEKSLAAGETALSDAGTALSSVESTIDDIQSALTETTRITAEVQKEMFDFTQSMTESFVDGTAQLTDISGRLNKKLSALTAGANQATSVVSSGLDDVSAIIEANETRISDLETHRPVDPADPLYQAYSDAITVLTDRNEQDKALLTSLELLNTNVSDVATQVQTAADEMNTVVSATATSASSIRDVMLSTIPGINLAMSELTAATGGFSASLAAQQILATESAALLEDLEGQLEQTRAASESLSVNLDAIENDLLTVRTDVSALSGAALWNQVEALTGLKPHQIAEFMASPVEVKERLVFPVKTYGSAMAPLFTNLSLWIAAFVLVVLLKQEVDTEGIEGLTVRQAYIGRWMLFACINFFQALLVSVGNVVIGVQMASAVAYVLTSVFVGFVYMALIYSLAVSFGYVGKGIVILLVIMQIPGASGIYPIEMMPGFFRALFPYFPFTYGIDAMRETIGGFYRADYWVSFAVLVVYAALAFLLGLFFRQRLGNFARLFNHRLSETGLFVSENVQVLGSRRRITQLVQALTNRERFREATEKKARWLEERHLTLLRVALLIGIVVTALLGLAGWLFPEGKATVLALWGVMCLLVIVFVVTLEYLKQNIRYARRVSSLDAHSLKTQLEAEERATHSDAVLEKIRERA